MGIRFNILGIVLLAALLVGCEKSKNATITAALTGMNNKVVFIEELAPGKTILLDSITTNKRGEFDYKYNFIDDNPVFVRLRIDQDFITLLLTPEERVVVESIINLSTNYTVTGSEGSELVREINQSLLSNNQIIEDNVLRYKSTTIESERNEIDRNLSQLFRHIRRECVEFLVRNSKSMASVMVLYQTYPNGQSIFGGENDHLFFSKIADSLNLKYPTSPHVKQLVNSIGEYHDRVNTLNNLIKTSKPLPEIRLPDIYGNEQELTSLIGDKAVLLVFWSAADNSSALINRELKDIYAKYKDKGLEIFQVSLDTNKSLWLEEVIETNLPWISVRDANGPTGSVSARTYQVNVLPYNFLITKEGVPLYKNLWGDQLVEKIEEVTK